MRILALLLLLLLHPVSRAEEAALQMVGEARLQVLFWPVYNSRLYSPGGVYQQGQRPLRFEIEYLRDIEASDLVARTGEEWERQQPLSNDEQQWLQQLVQIWPDVSASDVLALAVDERGASTFQLNGRNLGVIDDPAFGERFLSIWLAPDTSRPELRLGLLGIN